MRDHAFSKNATILLSLILGIFLIIKLIKGRWDMAWHLHGGIEKCIQNFG
jgi:hypothetical protein